MDRADRTVSGRTSHRHRRSRIRSWSFLEADLREEGRQAGLHNGPDGNLNLTDDEKKAFIEDIRQALYASRSSPTPSFKRDYHCCRRIWLGYRSGCRGTHLAWRLHHPCEVPQPYFRSIESIEANVALFRSVLSRTPSKPPKKSWRNVGWLRPPSTVYLLRRSLPRCRTSTDCVQRLPAALIHSQRDYFGAHTYQRVDQPAAFHTLWAEPGREEIEA